MRLHHQNAEIGDLRNPRAPWRLSDLFRITLLLAFVLAAYALGANNDDRAVEIATAIQAAEKTQQRTAMTKKMSEAYEQGLSDALIVLRETPKGVALAQACMAARSR